MNAVLLTVSCLFASSAAAQPPAEFRGIKRVDLRISAGDVRVRAAEADAATVEVTKKRYDERCRLVVEQKGDLLFVELGSKSLYSARCEADFDLRLPSIVGLKFKNGSGDVDVKAVKLSALDVRTGSGSVRAEGLEAPATTVSTGSGSVRLVYDRVPADGRLEIRSGSGDAEVLFPASAKVRTRFLTGSGKLRNRLGDSPNAKFTLSMKTGSGDLVVGKF